jgi:cobalamin synthase
MKPLDPVPAPMDSDLERTDAAADRAAYALVGILLGEIAFFVYIAARHGDWLWFWSR